MNDKIIGATCKHGVFFPPCYQCENQALRDELAALRQSMSALGSHNLKQGMMLAQMGVEPEDLAKVSINKIKADAIQGLIAAKFTNVYIEGTEWPVIYVEDAHAYVNQVEKGQ